VEKLLNPQQLAEVLNVKSGTVYSWLSRGVDFPPFVKIGGSIRFREKAVEAWLLAREKEKKRRNFAL
jgi:excisionase family DNA binding protein